MKSNQLIAMGGIALVFCLGLSQLTAQDNPPPGGDRPGRGGRGGGNFDPAQFQQRMLERTQEQLEIKDDAEWKVIQPMVQKVMDARLQSFRGGFGRGGRGGPGGPGAFGPPNPEAEALQKAIDSNAPSADLKAALAKCVASQKAKQAELEKVQAELRKVLTPRQEAIASLNGLL